MTIQNCTLRDSLSTTTDTHPAAIMLYRVNNVLVYNCWLYNNKNTAADAYHYAGILIFGINGPSTGVVIEKCTFVNSSCIYVAEDNAAVDNVTIRQCYFDMTLAETNFNQHVAITGFGKTGSGLIASAFHNNIVKGGNLYDMSGTAPSSVGVSIYNTTWDRAGGGAGYGSTVAGIRCEETSGTSKIFSCYNNLIYDNGATSFAGWKSATGGDAHSTTSSTNPFTSNGTYALQYQVSAGSPAYQTGRVGGVVSGKACNVGAWDGPFRRSVAA